MSFIFAVDAKVCESCALDEGKDVGESICGLPLAAAVLCVKTKDLKKADE